MARKKKGLAQTAAALAATALVEKAIQKAAENPRVRRKAKALGRALKKRAKAAGKKISKGSGSGHRRSAAPPPQDGESEPAPERLVTLPH